MLIEHQVAIANVGANDRHYKKYGKIKSPIFEDGRFEFIPVPTGKLSSKYEVMIDRIKDWPRYESLKSFYNARQKLAKYLPERTRDRWLSQPMHNDPLFWPTSKHGTYGDCYGSRSGNLWKLSNGDYILFLAHLWNWKDSDGFEGDGGFYLIGFVEIERIISFDSLNERELHRTLEPYRENSHALAWFKLHSVSKWSKLLEFENHRIFVGTRNSRRFQKAVPFDWKAASRVLRNRNGQKLRRDGGTSISRIGSYTRSVGLIDGTKAKDRKKILREHIKAFAGCNLNI